MRTESRSPRAKSTSSTPTTPARFTGFLPVVDGEARASLPVRQLQRHLLDRQLRRQDRHGRQLPALGRRLPGRQGQADAEPVGAQRQEVVDRHAADGQHVAQTAEWTRADRADGGMDSIFAYGAGSTVYVTPTAAVKIGQLHWMTGWTLRGAPEHGIPYSYDASVLPRPAGSAASQRHVVTRAQETVLDSRYYTDGADRNSTFVRTPVYPFQFRDFHQLRQLNPLRCTGPEYVIGPKGRSSGRQPCWPIRPRRTLRREVDDGYRSYVPGSIERVDWLRGALAPGAVADTPGNPFWACAVCRTRGSLSVDLAPGRRLGARSFRSRSRSPASGHAARFRIYRNGKVLDDEYDVDRRDIQHSGREGDLPGDRQRAAGPGRIRRIDDVHGGRVVPVRRRIRRKAADRLGMRARPDQGPARFRAMLQANLPVTHRSDRATAGRSRRSPVSRSATFRGRRPDRRSVRRALQLSFDGGNPGARRQRSPRAAAGSALYWSNPDSQIGHRVSVRVTAADALGGSLTETVLNAYAVSSR